MKTTIDVATRRDGELVKQALADPEVRAFVTVMGALQALPSARARSRVLVSVSDRLAEDSEAAGHPRESR